MQSRETGREKSQCLVVHVAIGLHARDQENRELSKALQERSYLNWNLQDDVHQEQVLKGKVQIKDRDANNTGYLGNEDWLSFLGRNTWVGYVKCGWQSTMGLDYKCLYIAIPRNLEFTGSGKATGFLPHNNLCVERKLQLYRNKWYFPYNVFKSFRLSMLVLVNIFHVYTAKRMVGYFFAG